MMSSEDGESRAGPGSGSFTGRRLEGTQSTQGTVARSPPSWASGYLPQISTIYWGDSISTTDIYYLQRWQVTVRYVDTSYRHIIDIYSRCERSHFSLWASEYHHSWPWVRPSEYCIVLCIMFCLTMYPFKCHCCRRATESESSFSKLFLSLSEI